MLEALTVSYIILLLLTCILIHFSECERGEIIARVQVIVQGPGFINGNVCTYAAYMGNHNSLCLQLRKQAWKCCSRDERPMVHLLTSSLHMKIPWGKTNK